MMMAVLSSNPSDFDQCLPSSQFKVSKEVMPSYYSPGPYTVLCGRGREFFNSVGNRRFRVIAGIHLARYSRAESRSDKTAIVSSIVGTVRSAGGAFVKREKQQWIEVGDAVAREKVGAYLRDCLHTKYKSASKSKLARRKAMANERPDSSIDLWDFRVGDDDLSDSEFSDVESLGDFILATV